MAELDKLIRNQNAIKIQISRITDRINETQTKFISKENFNLTEAKTGGNFPVTEGNKSYPKLNL